MSRLEEAASQIVEPLIESLIEPRKQEIDAKLLPALAAWSVKTAMVLESLTPTLSPFYSASDREQLRLMHKISQRTYVWLAACAEHKNIYAEASTYSAEIGRQAFTG
jgi:hypothetical protein